VQTQDSHAQKSNQGFKKVIPALQLNIKNKNKKQSNLRYDSAA